MSKSRYVGRFKPSFYPGVIACRGCKYLNDKGFTCIGMDQKVTEIKKCPLGGISAPRKLIREWKPTFGLMPQKLVAAPEVYIEEDVKITVFPTGSKKVIKPNIKRKDPKPPKRPKSPAGDFGLTIKVNSVEQEHIYF